MSEMIYDQYGNPLFTVSNPGSTQVLGGQTAATQAPVAVTQAPKGPYQTLKTFTGTVSTSTTVTTTAKLNGASDYTVTTGKTFYLTDVIICNNTANAATITVQGGGNPVITGHSLNTAPFDATNIGTEPSVAGGQVVNLSIPATSGGVTTLSFFIGGYEQ